MEIFRVWEALEIHTGGHRSQRMTVLRNMSLGNGAETKHLAKGERTGGQCRLRGLESTSIQAITEQAVSKDVH